MKTRVHRTIKAVLGGLLLGLLLVPAAWAQETFEGTTTEQRLRALRQQISADEQRLANNTQPQEASLATLESLDRELAVRGELTVNYQARLDELALSSDSLRASLEQMEDDLGALQEQYQRRATHAYKYGRMHDLALILSATSINQMLIRARYLTRFTDQRRAKLNAIKDATTLLEDRRTKLVEARVQTQLLLREAKLEQQRMQRLQQNRQGVIRNLRSQPTAITQALNQKQTATSDFERRIRDVITTEDTRRRSEASPEAEVDYASLTGSFMSNKGNLPWPVSGVVVEPFGDLINPVHGTTTPNPGMLVATKPQAEVRAIFDGIVLSISVVPEFGRYVTIQHGEYQSVYSNFSMIYIAEDMRVKAGQVIGRAGTDAEPKEAGLFFGLFRNGTPLDPKPWLQVQ